MFSISTLLGELRYFQYERAFGQTCNGCLSIMTVLYKVRTVETSNQHTEKTSGSPARPLNLSTELQTRICDRINRTNLTAPFFECQTNVSVKGARMESGIGHLPRSIQPCLLQNKTTLRIQSPTRSDSIQCGQSWSLTPKFEKKVIK